TPLSPLLAAVYNLAIDDLPLLKPIDYDVKWWSRGYEGSMAFIGANTRINPDGGKFEGFYAFPDAVGNNMIKKGDIISNRGPILAHASPYKPMEFCLRQSMSHPDSDLPDYEDYWEFGFARRIIFEIDFITARNVAPWSAPDREELIFLADRRFKVVEIDEATFNYKTLALVVRLQEIPESSVPKKTPYRDLISGETYYSPIPINELELKKIIDLSNEKQNPLINKIISYVKNR
ncbi:hypothetical protein ON011_002213, partial [Providencia rettgeri]|nr:hypothetical protein [Providencia rettgeri]